MKKSFWKSIIFPERRPIVQGNAQKRVDTKVFSPAEQIRLVKKWKKSGLTQAEFCRREKITEWQLSSWKLKVSRQNKNLPKPDFVEIDLLSQKEAAKKEQADREIEKHSARPDPVKAFAEIRFHGASLCILPGAAVADLKNILMDLMECASDRTK